MKLSMKMSGGYAIVLGLMAIVSVVVYNSINSLVDSSKWVNHTYEVIRTAESVGASMVDMETGQRGFMMAGKDEYLEPFTNGEAAFEKLTAEGRELTSDNPVQVSRWDEIKNMKGQWLLEAASPEIAARREVTKGAAANAQFKKVSARTVGKEIFDSIRAALAEIDRKFAGNKAGKHLVTLTTLDLVNMETGQRGFLLTGKDESLEPYINGANSLNGDLDDLVRVAAGYCCHAPRISGRCETG